MTSLRRVLARGALALALLALACDKQAAGTDTPADDPGSRLEGREGTVGGTPGADGTAAQSGQTLPKVQDRDPEEEKRKMARSRAQSAKAEDALTSGRLVPAIEAAREALRLHEQNVHAMLVIAEAYYRQGKYEIVQAVITSGLAVDPKIRTPAETSRLYNLQGFAMLAMGKDSLATQSFKKAAENDEKNASAWNNLGTRYLEAGDIKTARSCFEYAVELDARFYKAHLNLGAAQRAEGQWKEAETSFLTALKLRPSYPEAYFDLGILYLDADPFPGLDSTQRLNKSISYLTKYRDMASSTSSRPAAKSSAAKADPPAATREIADDYIRVAKKGLDRLQRDAERGKAKPAEAGTGATSADAGGESGATAAPSGPQKPGAAPSDKPSAQSPAPARPEPSAPSKPGATPADPPPADTPPSAPPASPSKPQSPAPVSPAKPQSPTPVAPSKPTPTPVSPQKPPSATPPSATPPSATPPSATPPSATPPSASPPSATPPSATPPSASPPTPVAPQKPAPVAPQKPSSAAVDRGPARAPASERAFAPPLDRLAYRAEPRRAEKKSLASRGTRGVDSTLSTSARVREAGLDRLGRARAVSPLSRPTTFARCVLTARLGSRDRVF